MKLFIAGALLEVGEIADCLRGPVERTGAVGAR